jgi:hypothetical protein
METNAKKGNKRLLVVLAIVGVVLAVGIGLGIGFREQIAALFRGNEGTTEIRKPGGNLANANPTDIQVVEVLYTDNVMLTNTGTQKLIPTGINNPESDEIAKFIYGFQFAWVGLSVGDRINVTVDDLWIGTGDDKADYEDQFIFKYAFGTTHPTSVDGTAANNAYQYTVGAAEGQVYLFVSIEFAHSNEEIDDEIALGLSGGEISYMVRTSVTKQVA